MVKLEASVPALVTFIATISTIFPYDVTSLQKHSERGGMVLLDKLIRQYFLIAESLMVARSLIFKIHNTIVSESLFQNYLGAQIVPVMNSIKHVKKLLNTDSVLQEINLEVIHCQIQPEVESPYRFC
ncbi:uncharacterized protein BT62DRAFT_921513 [Guyanagaster necrorhizus]|uniref:Uncharacterized protein n=1 Tax=Guyanagaster necrorhizus TaxID=856835 RepID=A0A9P7VNK2_9AGAR|nr:uncharacterized protein BT62DRAFT_921513 [Guyanagaster necrorhizus MCA 3950]KAG7443845.1 hypothetical protein BT62DRAFT_921513 [Guyanagaster necrorhizus MCA 3950]